jgi:hypothetical protein
MKFSPKAHRFVARAIRDLPDAAATCSVEAWLKFPPNTDLSGEMMALAAVALEKCAQSMRQALDTADDDQKPELINDLRFIDALRQSLKDEAPSRKYA